MNEMNKSNKNLKRKFIPRTFSLTYPTRTQQAGSKCTPILSISIHNSRTIALYEQNIQVPTSVVYHKLRFLFSFSFS